MGSLLGIAIFAGAVIGSETAAWRPAIVGPLTNADTLLFSATLASLADSIQSIGRMIGTADDHVQLRVDPRPLRIPTAVAIRPDEKLLNIANVAFDSLDAREKIERQGKIVAMGFGVGDLDSLSRCPAAEVLPPDAPPGTPPPPPPCSLAPAAVAGIGVAQRTQDSATVRVVIYAAIPYKQAFSADFVFARAGAWRLVRRGPWTIAE
jgi:hypothetical protein